MNGEPTSPVPQAIRRADEVHRLPRRQLPPDRPRAPQIFQSGVSAILLAAIDRIEVPRRRLGIERHAIVREKQIKAGSRAKKIALIERENPEWLDLSGAILP